MRIGFFSRFLSVFGPAAMLAGFMLLLVSCGSGGGPGGGVAGEGNVALLLTDGPTDEFKEINVRITKVELLGDSGHVTLFTGDKVVDLLRLTGESSIFSVSTGVPAWTFSKIRLHVSSIELVRFDSTTVHPKLPKNGRIDLNPRSHFHVRHGKTLVVKLDMDAEKSIHVVKAGNSGKYIFRPVVFVEVRKFLATDRLVRVTGVVRGIDFDAGVFRLCPGDTVFKAKTQGGNGAHLDDGHEGYDSDPATPDRCVPVHVDANERATSFFDSDGLPTEFAFLTDNSRVTAVGRVRLIDHWSQASYWYDGVCDSGDCPVGLDAEVVEFGDFLSLKGTARSEPDPDTFDFEVAGGQGIVEGSVLAAELQEGAKVFSRRGVELAPGDIKDGLGARLDGVLLVRESDPDLLRTALVILDLAPDGLHARIEGTVDSILGDGKFEIIEEGETGATCVATTEKTFFFLVTDGNGGFTSTEKTFDEVEEGRAVEIYGEPGSGGCFAAKVVLIEPPAEI